ncbi:unnamed protein product [Nesidiocoris tenuis]|uniref:Breast cancer metastasis-suppressor 1-like protein-A n=1 Tax=Nesidiocoris tenuis TaxID=355587 RepID=A0A6H5FZM2_9HEMI|nr:unnamed protein product [Nesidiocoris tenuis]
MPTLSNESEGEDMDYDDSDSENYSSTSGDSDSDGSALDAQEYRKRRNELIDRLTSLETQYAILKEQLYTEKIHHTNALLERLQSGTAEEFKKPLEELRQNMTNRIQVAGALKNFRIEAINNRHTAEKLACEQNLQNDKSLLLAELQENIEMKMRKLEEARNNARFPSYEQLLKKNRKQMMKKRKIEGCRRKPVAVKGPYVVYQLDEESIIEDWATIKKSLQLKRCLQKGSR